MRLTRAVLTVAAVLAVALPALAQAPKKTEPAAAAQGAPPMPKPGPEHQLFQQDAGTWDAKVEVWMAPGAPMVSTGVEVNTVGCGGLCLITDFKGEMAPGVTFHGHGTSAWDPAKKKYVGNWTDSMASGIAVGESTYDATKKVATGWMEGPDETGKVAKSKAIVEYSGGDRVFSMYKALPDGKEVLGMRITYKKRQ